MPLKHGVGFAFIHCLKRLERRTKPKSRGIAAPPRYSKESLHSVERLFNALSYANATIPLEKCTLKCLIVAEMKQ